MTAIKTTNIVEGNLAQEPKYFPQGQYVARIVFRIMHTDRKLNPQTNQWEDGRTTAVDVNFYGATAERYAQTIQQQPDAFAKGTAVAAWGELSDRPNTWTDRDGNPRPHPSSTARASSPTSSSTSVVPIASNPIPPACRNTPTRSRNRTRGRDNRHRPEPSRTATGGRSTMTAPSIRMKKGTWKWNASKPLI
ncbi:single-stranded DNA-binding protein [Bifidobacterium adolescentis]|nr:single-stranded DNA-binding protein [Bifidobacterium adolescentis]